MLIQIINVLLNLYQHCNYKSNNCYPIKIKKNITLTLAGQLISAIIGFVFVVLIARILGPEGNGYYAMAILLPGFMGTFLNLGIGPANAYYLGKGEVDVKTSLYANLIISAALSIVGTLIGAIGIIFFSQSLFPDVPKLLLWIGLVGFPAQLLNNILGTLLQGCEDFKAYNIGQILSPTFKLIFLLIALLVFKLDTGGAVGAFVLAQFVSIIILYILLKPHLEEIISSTAKAVKAYIRKSLEFGWKAHLSNILSFVNYKTDIFLVNFFINPAATGIYVIAVQITERLWMLSKAVSSVILPRLSALHKEKEQRQQLTSKSFRVTVALTFFGSLILAAVIWPLLKYVFGNEYLDSLYPILFLLPGIIVGAGARVLANTIAAQGRPELNMYVSATIVLINVTANILLIPLWGLEGAAIATTLAYSMDALIKIVLYKKIEIGLSLRSLLPVYSDYKFLFNKYF